MNLRCILVDIALFMNDRWINLGDWDFLSLQILGTTFNICNLSVEVAVVVRIVFERVWGACIANGIRLENALLVLANFELLLD